MGVDVNYCRQAYPIPSGLLNDIAIDIGANIGGFSKAYNNSFKKIFYFEANPETFKITKKNLEPFKNISGYNLAVSDESDKKLILMDHFNGHNGSVTCSPSITETNHKDWVKVIGEVNTISLEGIYDLIGGKRINYLKIDCENSEYEFLINKDLSKIDFIAMELHSQMGEEKYNELIKYLEKYFTIKGNTSYNINYNTMLYLSKK